MVPENNFEYEVWGPNALFTNVLVRGGGEKATYQVPTYQALIGITESIYFKPTFIFVIDKVRIMNPIKVESKAVRPFDKNFTLDKNTLAYYLYLQHVRYQVKCHLAWNMQRDDLKQDRNLKKHVAIFNRALKRGGRRDIFLGTRECQAYVKPQAFGTGEGAYDGQGKRQLGLMFHGFNYPNETGNEVLSVRFWEPTMENGIITFEKPQDIQEIQDIRRIKDYGFDHLPVYQTADELYEELFEGGGH